MKKIINISGIPGLILMAALVFMPVSCNKDAVKDNPLPGSSSQLIKVSGEDVSVATKTTLNLLVTSLVANTDFVGIYSPDARPTSDCAAGVTNRQFSASTTAFSSAFTAIAGNEMYWGNATPHRFYAYYQFSAGLPASSAVPISLPTAQTQVGNSSTHIGNYDFMVATPVTDATPGAAGAATTVNLRYNHVFTVLEFQIKRSSGSGKITKVKLTALTTNLSLATGSTIDITAAPYTITPSADGTKEITLTITGGVTPTNGYGTTPKIYMMILPGNFSAESMTIGIEYENSGVFENTTKTGKIFERGKKYVVQMDDTPSTVTDADLNVYNTIRIGSQVWMAENLKTTKYLNGDLIGTTTPATLDISNVTTYPTPKYQWAYDGNESNVATYGRLYTWHAATDSRNICPTGWHLPTDAEWTALTTFVGSNPGNQLKEAGSSHWGSSNTGANNSSGFTALPGGDRYDDGTFHFIGYDGDGYWWSSTEYSTSNAWGRNVYCGAGVVSRYGGYKTYGFSVRCIKD